MKIAKNGRSGCSGDLLQDLTYVNYCSMRKDDKELLMKAMFDVAVV